MSRETALVTADWVAENLNNPKVVIVEVDEDTALYAQATSKTQLPLTGARTFKTDFAATSSRRKALKPSFQRAVSQMTQQSFSTVAITTGLPPMRTGTSSSTATRMYASLMADASAGSSMLAHS